MYTMGITKMEHLFQVIVKKKVSFTQEKTACKKIVKKLTINGKKHVRHTDQQFLVLSIKGFS